MSRFMTDASQWRQLRMELQQFKDSFKAVIVNGWCVEMGNPSLGDPKYLCVQYVVTSTGHFDRKVLGSGTDPHAAIKSALDAQRLTAKCPECGHPRHLPKDCGDAGCPCTYHRLATKHGWPI